MKKQLLLSLMAAATLTMAADTVTPDWSGTTINGNFTNIPEGWGVYGSDAYFSGSGTGITIYSNDNSACLVSPRITGEMTFSIQPSFDFSDFFASLYVFENNNGVYTKLNSIQGNFDSYESKKTYTVTVEPGQCVGFQIEYGIVSDIIYTPYADDGTERPSLKVSNGSFGENVENLLSDYEGNVPFTFTVDVTNNGTTTFNPGDEGYEVTLYEGTDNIIMTQPIAVTLAPEETTTVTLSGSFAMATLMEGKNVSSNGAYRAGFNVKDGIKGSTLSSNRWMDVWPMWIYFDTREGSSKATSLDFGFQSGTEAVSRTLTVRNLCINPLDINYITVPEGYTLETQLPISIPSTLESSASADLTVTMNGDATGVMAGEMVIYVDGAEEPARIKLSGARVGGDSYFENFEDCEEGTTLPAGWIGDPSGNVKVKTWPSSWNMADNVFCLDNSSSSDIYTGRVISPRLSAGENEYLVFQASARSNSSVTPIVKVYYSTDRTNWSELLTVRNPAYASDDQQSFSSSIPGYSYEGTAPSTHSVLLPEGEGYVAFDLLYARIDNIFGAHRAYAEHDYYISGSSVAATGMVNYPVRASVTVDNLSATEAAGSYTVTLEAGDQTLATLETPVEMIQGTNKYTLSFTPHQVGEMNVRVVVASGDYAVATSESTVTIVAETADADYTVGSGTPTVANNGNKTTPFRTYDKKSHAQMIYTADYLEQYGVMPGTEITAISFDGWLGKTLTGPVKIYMMPTEMTGITPDAKLEIAAIQEAATCVFNEESYVMEKVGSQAEPVTLPAFTFIEPYVYNGGNLFILFMKEHSEYDLSGTGFVNDASQASKAIVRSSDTNVDGASYMQSCGLAQTHFYYSMTPATYSGTVENSSTHAAIADATVTLTSGDVLYSGTSDASGAFSVEVIQSGKEYNVTVAATDYNDYTGTVSFADGNVTDTIQLVSSTGSGVSNLTADGMNLCVLDDMITVDADATLRIFATNGTMLSRVNGNAISTRGLAAGVYILTVESAQGNTTVRFVKK